MLLARISISVAPNTKMGSEMGISDGLTYSLSLSPLRYPPALGVRAPSVPHSLPFAKR